MPASRGARTRRRIMEAAVRRFSTDGFDAASVDAICALAGVSKGAFYHHFASKQQLFLALLEEWLAGLDQAMLSARRPTVPGTLLQMTAMLPIAAGGARNHLGMWLEFWLQASRDKQVWKATIAPYRRYRESFRRLLEAGIAEGSLRQMDTRSAAQAMVSLAVGLFLQSVLEPRGTNWRRTAEDSMRIFLSGLQAGTQ